MDNDHVYDLIITHGTDETLVKLGEHKGWLEQYKNILEQAHTLALVSKVPGAMPTVVVRLAPGQRWIYFRKTLGTAGTDKQVRVYAIGWQETIGGRNVKSIAWVYPNGAIEVGEFPSFWKRFL